MKTNECSTHNTTTPDQQSRDLPTEKMADTNKRLEELEKYQNRIVSSINELNVTSIDMKLQISKIEKENEELRQLVKANWTNIIIEQA